MMIYFDDDPHLSHAEVEHGADVDDEEEGTDDREGEHWEELKMKTRMSTRRREKDDMDEYQRAQRKQDWDDNEDEDEDGKE